MDPSLSTIGTWIGIGFCISQSALFLHWWLGKESIQYFREHNMREVLKRHIEADEPDAP